jgi:hypothetical protein
MMRLYLFMTGFSDHCEADEMNVLHAGWCLEDAASRVEDLENIVTRSVML